MKTLLGRKSPIMRWLFGIHGGEPHPGGATAATDHARETLAAELAAAAKAHRVEVDLGMMAYLVTPDGFVAHVPLREISRYRDADFEAGAPIQLLVVRSARRESVPSGSYVVKAQHAPGARSGTAFFLDRTGAVAARSELSVRSWREMHEMFPGLYPGDEPQNIPVVTSVHYVPTWNGIPRQVVDCAGWNPYRVVWYGLDLKEGPE